MWPWLLTIASVVILTTLFLGVFGYIPGISDMERVLTVTLSMAASALVLFLMAFVAGFARDIQAVDLATAGQSVMRRG